MTDQGLRQLSTAEKRALLARILQKQSGPATTVATKPETLLKPDIASRHEPFPLTDVQRAYWLGRGSFFELGQVSCHAYAEYDLTGADLARLQAAWQKLVARHDMLRAIIREDGLQQILPEVPDYQIEHLDLRDCDPAQTQMHLAAVRNRMSHQVRPANQWPLFELRTSGLDGQTILHLSLDLLILDFWSIQLLVGEWQKLIATPDLQLPPLTVSFRDYALAATPRQDSASYRAAEAYWRHRLESLPPPPSLPLAKSPSAIARPRFARRKAVLERALWQRLKSKSANAGLTPSVTFIAAFARVLAAWSRTPDFCLNLTLFNRLPLHPQVNRLVGDFTSILLLEVHADPAETFPAMAKTLGSRLWSDLEHNAYGGIKLLEDMAKRDAKQQSMPVVFTSTLGNAAPVGESADSWRGGLGNVLYSVTQTPQVWLDHQIFEQDGCVYLIWDAVEELFPPGLLDDMFASYFNYLSRLAQDDTAWSETHTSLVPAAQMSLRAAMNDTAAPVPSGLLHTPFFEQARARPQQIAVVTPERRLSYAEVDRRARRLARQLRRMGAGPNRLVAVAMEKSWEQVVGVLAILQAGGAYLAVDPDLPQERRWLLLQRGEADIVLTQSCLAARLDWPPGVQCLSVDIEQDDIDGEPDAALEPAPKSDDLAYVIFTSGSTGEPKGVMVEHRSALNTVLDINERFAVGPDDRILALSSLSFDLSVYDIFGALAAGATIVMPHQTSSREPRDWASLVVREGVTIWNSVPALLDLLVDHVGDRTALLGKSLRLALLSGDWIPVRLPDKARAVVDGLQVVSLGGATEASIWSILYPVGTVRRDWPSIPYGHPLRNQQMHVLNDAMEPCPAFVPGHLFIGGVGLARGYWRDVATTDARFVRHPRSGERLYRTGDLGRYLADGNIEFLGREDHQVKVQGHRIELGEIEAVLERHPAVNAAVVVAVGEKASPKYLAAYVVADVVAVETLTEHLRQKLPGYMVPAVWHKLGALPLTANGKVDRKALPAAVRPVPAEPAAPAEQSDAVARIRALISDELALAALDPHQNLLTIGATSLDLVRIVQRLDKEFGFVLSFQQFAQEPTIEALARLIERQRHEGLTKMNGARPAAPRRSVKMILDPAAREAFHHENHAIRDAPAELGTLPLWREQPSTELEQHLQHRRAARSFLPAPVPLATLGAWLTALSRTMVGGAAKYTYGSAGACYPVQAYLHAKQGGIAGCPAGTFYYHPIDHRLVPLTLGAELDASIHEPFTNRPIFERARFSLFFVSQPRAIEPIYGEMAERFSLIEAGAMAHALESSAWRFGLGVCPIGWLDFPAIRGLFQLEEGQELLHAHVGGLVEAAPDVGDREEGVV